MPSASVEWPNRPLFERLRIVCGLRHRLADDPDRFVDAIELPFRQNPIDTLTAEIIPLADACRFLRRRAPSILRSRRLGWRHRPAWLFGVTAEVQCVPFGVVAVIGPQNYPLFLPGVQIIQALAAGNRVVFKPAPGTMPIATLLVATLHDLGVPADALTLLDERPEALDWKRIDKVVLTGSTDTGRAVLRRCADELLPSTMELSGEDAMIVLPGANLDRTIRCLRFGRTLNGGFSCIAPRRLLVHESIGKHVLDRLSDEERDALSPQLVADDDAIVHAVAGHPMRLGATIFGPIGHARRLAARLPVGSVVINDGIVPTADPRLPFGGGGHSGFGVTRGAEGLLEMTRPKSISIRRRGILFHLRPPQPSDRNVLQAQFSMTHGSTILRRAAGLRRLVGAARSRTT